MEDFPEFITLPEEMQSEILSQYPDILAKTRRINKNISEISKQNYLKQICDLPISKGEIQKYMEDVPDFVNIFVWHYEGNLTNFHIIEEDIGLYKLAAFLKFLPFNAEYMAFNREYSGPRFVFSKEIIGLGYDSKVYQLVHPDKRNNQGVYTDTIINLMQAYDYDLIVKYHIYRERGCDNLEPGFSKNKILQDLDDHYDKTDIANYLDQVAMNVYLRANAASLGIRQGPRPFAAFEITLGHNHKILNAEDVFSGATFDSNLIMDLINKTNLDLYVQLRQAILRLP
jgi:hypothetical protein